MGKNFFIPSTHKAANTEAMEGEYIPAGVKTLQEERDEMIAELEKSYDAAQAVVQEMEKREDLKRGAKVLCSIAFGIAAAYLLVHSDTSEDNLTKEATIQTEPAIQPKP